MWIFLLFVPTLLYRLINIHPPSPIFLFLSFPFPLSLPNPSFSQNIHPITPPPHPLPRPVDYKEIQNYHVPIKVSAKNHHHWSTIGYPHCWRLVGDPQIYWRPQYFHWRHSNYHLRPQICIGDPQFSFENPKLLLGDPIFSLILQIIVGYLLSYFHLRPQISVGDPHIFLETPRNALEAQQIFIR